MTRGIRRAYKESVLGCYFFFAVPESIIVLLGEYSMDRKIPCVGENKNNWLFELLPNTK